jgi:glycosyltransferase involved in cell wall biosynthesis
VGENLGSMITVASYGQRGSSARVRIHDWLKYLDIPASRNYDYVGGSNNSISTLARDIPGVVRAELELRQLARSPIADTLLMSREASPLSNGIIESRLLRKAALSVYDFDDAIFHSAAPFPYNLYPKDKVWLRSVSAADRVIAGNEWLAEESSRHNPSVTMIPSCVDPAEYEEKTDYSLNDQPTLLWMGSPATEPFLDELAGPLLEVNEEVRIRLKVVSAGNRSFGKLDELVERIPWSADSYGSHMVSADLGIMPLPDNEFTRGKCAYKILQYGAAALPVMGSPVGTNHSVLDQMGAPAPADSSQWKAAILDFLKSSDSDRQQLGRSAHEVVLRKYSFEAWSPVWRQTMELPA